MFNPEKLSTSPSEEKTEKEPSAKIIIPSVIGGKKRTPEEEKYYKRIREEIEREETIREKKQKGKLLSAKEAAFLREIEMRQEENRSKQKVTQEAVQAEAQPTTTLEQEATPATVSVKAPEAPEVAPQEREITIEELIRELDEKRKDYVKEDREFKKAQKKGETGFTAKELELERARLEYEEIKSRYARELYLRKIKQLEGMGINKNDPRFEKEIGLLKAALFKEVIINEQDKLAKEKVDELEPRKRTWFRKMISDYAKMPMWKKVLISTGIVTGAMFIGGGIGGVGAAAAFGGYRFIKGMISGQLAMLAGGLVKTIGTKKVEEYRQEEIDKLNSQFGTDIEKIDEKDQFQVMFKNRCDEYEKIVKEVNKKHRNITKWSIAAGVVAGGTTAVGLTMTNLDGPLSDMFNQRLGLVEVPPATEVPTTEVPTEAPVVESVMEVQRGGSVWKLAEEQLENRGYFENLTGTPEEILAKRTYLIDVIKDKIVENPRDFGISSGNADILRVGDEIDFSSIFEGKEIEADIREPVTEPVKEPVAEEPVTEPVKEPVAEEPVTEPVKEPVAKELVTEPVKEPVAEITYNTITNELSKRFGMFTTDFNRVSGINTEEFLKLEFDPKSDIKYNLGEDHYNYKEINNFQDWMKNIFKNIPERDKELANSLSVGNFVEKYFDFIDNLQF